MPLANTDLNHPVPPPAPWFDAVATSCEEISGRIAAHHGELRSIAIRAEGRLLVVRATSVGGSRLDTCRTLTARVTPLWLGPLADAAIGCQVTVQGLVVTATADVMVEVATAGDLRAWERRTSPGVSAGSPRDDQAPALDLRDPDPRPSSAPDRGGH
ncbi:hypothetical protein BH24ACT3_BH24ACT3_09830 [soil metagenome]